MRISQKYVQDGPISNKPALVYTRARLQKSDSMEALKGHVKFLKTACVSPN